jgi:hypothetical protein
MDVFSLILFYFIIWITCNLNFTWFKKLLKMQLIN